MKGAEDAGMCATVVMHDNIMVQPRLSHVFMCDVSLVNYTMLFINKSVHRASPNNAKVVIGNLVLYKLLE